jgi:hypothetical protein
MNGPADPGTPLDGDATPPETAGEASIVLDGDDDLVPL